jgi:sterol 3beta-glucosyltransferase
LTSSIGIRLIVIKGWGLNDTSLLENNNNILVLNSAPYEKLFPLVKAVIHHGGIGTIAACIKSGKPFLTCPVLYPLGDQYFWGEIAFQKGLGLKPIPLKKMTIDKLVALVKELISNQYLYQNAASISNKLKFENGVDNAIKLIEFYSAKK